MEKIDIRHYVTDYLDHMGMGWTLNKEVRLEHEGCPAGIDTRKRFYFKAVTPRGSWLAHCFNCGGSGYHFEGRQTSNIHELLEELKDIVPTDNAYNGTKSSDVLDKHYTERVTSPIALAWLYQAGLDNADITTLGITGHPTSDSIRIPINSTSSVIRSFDSQRYVYYTDTEAVPYVIGAPRGTFTTVITEDILSAYRCNSDAGVMGIALLGTSVRKSYTNTLLNVFSKLTNPSTTLVWMDEDLAGKRAVIDVAKAIKDISPVDRVKIVVGRVAPKKHSKEELQIAIKEELA